MQNTVYMEQRSHPGHVNENHKIESGHFLLRADKSLLDKSSLSNFFILVLEGKFEVGVLVVLFCFSLLVLF